MTRFGRTGLLSAALLALGGAAQAVPPGQEDGGPAISLPLDEDSTRSAFIETPKNDDLEREYPKVALMMDLGGRVEMTCKATIEGRLDDCHVVSEDPEGMGFGAATIRTAVYFRVRPATRDGKPVEDTITIPMRWQAAGHQPIVPIVLTPATPAALTLGRRVVRLQRVADQMQAGWQPFLKQQTAQTLAAGDKKASQPLVEAYKEGLDDVIQGEVERQAHELASRESEAELKATIAFLESEAGRAWIGAEAQSSADAPRDLYQRIGEAARARYCPKGVCPTAGVARASTKP